MRKKEQVQIIRLENGNEAEVATYLYMALDWIAVYDVIITDTKTGYQIATMQYVLVQAKDANLYQIRRFKRYGFNLFADALAAIRFAKEMKKHKGNLLCAAITWLHVERSYRHRGIAAWLIHMITDGVDGSVALRSTPVKYETMLMLPYNTTMIARIREQEQHNWKNLETHGWHMVPKSHTEHFPHAFAVLISCYTN